MTPEQVQLIVDAVNYNTMADIGLMCSLIFAVTWKG